MGKKLQHEGYAMNDMTSFKHLQLKKFDLRNIPKIAPAPAICMIAKRGSGKSWLIRRIVYENRDIDCGLVISRTEKMSPFFSEFFPDLFIYYAYSSEVLSDFLERQEDIKEKAAEKKLKGKFVDTRAFLIMDDCLATKGSWMKDEPILEVFFNGRHYNLFYILTMQYPLGIGPDLRGNFDFIFLFGETFPNIQKKLYEQYAGMFLNFEAFLHVFKMCTADFGCMVINNRIKSEELTDVVFWYKAEGTPDFMACSPKFIKHHYGRYDPNFKQKLRDMKRKKGYDMEAACGKKNKKINIKVKLEGK